MAGDHIASDGRAQSGQPDACDETQEMPETPPAPAAKAATCKLQMRSRIEIANQRRLRARLGPSCLTPALSRSLEIAEGPRRGRPGTLFDINRFLRLMSSHSRKDLNRGVSLYIRGP